MISKDPINISEAYERVNIEWSQVRREFLKVQVRFQVLESLTLLNEFPPGNVYINSTMYFLRLDKKSHFYLKINKYKE